MKKRIISAMAAALLASSMSAVPVFAQTTGTVSTETLFVRSNAGTDSSVLGLLDEGDAVVIEGQTDEGWYQISYCGQTAYVSGSYISGISETESPQETGDHAPEDNGSAQTDEQTAPASDPAANTQEEEAAPAQESQTKEEAAAPASTWTGAVLTKSAGVVYGPSGKETYYNLDMSGVINIMRNLGYTGEYWVRSDGAKMLGDYIMCAANLSVHPRGSLVESSMGTCIVCDTGGFAYSNPNQLDIATTW